MNSLRKTAAVLAAVALAMLVAAPAAATTSRVSYHCDAHLIDVLDEGHFWIDADGVMQLRGQVLVYELVGDPLCSGTLTGTANLNFDPATGSGAVWGKSTIELDAYDGGWTANLIAHWTNPNPLVPDAEDIWLGSSVRHGYGELEGWQARSTMLEKFHWLFFDDGYAFAPGS